MSTSYGPYRCGHGTLIALGCELCEPAPPSRHGCCADKACTDKTCMALPDGKTCGDCKHMTHCKSFYGHKPEDTYCDFFPRRFAPARPPATKPVEHRIQIGPLDI